VEGGRSWDSTSRKILQKKKERGNGPEFEEKGRQFNQLGWKKGNQRKIEKGLHSDSTPGPAT